MNLDAYAFKTATEAAEAIRVGETTSTTLTKYILARIAKYNPKLNAIVSLMQDQALQRAREADEALSNGINWGSLHGV
ncbi:MAG: amidase family protein, partial [Candidatus Bathyarchaeota archaeon]|nr:amidase family protein [Candidatus Bathyarchaeota archaeon]